MPASNDESRSYRWRFGNAEYAELSRELMVDGKAVTVEGKALGVLAELLKHPAQVVERERLLDKVWPEVATTDSSLSTAVFKLRKALNPDQNAYIRTVPGVGYKLISPVTRYVDDEQSPAPLILQPGDSIPYRHHWRAVRRLNSNDAAPVWLAQSERTRDLRVYKFAVDGVRLQALRREMTVYRLLTGSLGEGACFVVRLLEWNFEESPFFLESEFCGQNLQEWSNTADFASTSLEERVEIVAHLAAYIASAHAIAIFHNDLKPGNILISPQAARSSEPDKNAGSGGLRWNLKIADFGVASLHDLTLLRELDISDHGLFDEGHAAGSSLLGSALYRAPELRTGGAPTAQGDVYALGILLYQFACGDFNDYPYPGWEQKVTDPLLQQDIADAANVSPAKRITTVAELASRLQRLTARREETALKAREDAHAREIQQALAQARVRRPWIRLAIGSLAFGLLVALLSVVRAVRERNAEKTQATTLAAMYDFLAQDLLGQSNPYPNGSRGGGAVQQSLVGAIAVAAPQIDARFAHEPGIAGRLHETIGDSLRSRSQFSAADREYAVSAQRFRQAGPTFAQTAIILELKREFTAIASRAPGSLDAAQSGFTQQETVIAQLDNPSAELQAWEAIVKSGLVGLGPNPSEALPLLTAAVRRAEATPGFDPMLLVRLKKQFCGTYVRLGDGLGLERTSREIMVLLTREYGAESSALLPFKMYIEEALYLEGRYPETIAQANSNRVEFTRVLGLKDQLTIATLEPEAAAESQLELYDEAIRDSLAEYQAARTEPDDKRLEEGGLVNAAASECRRGDFAAGLQHAGQVMHDTGPGPLSQPAFFNVAMLTTAECLIAQADVPGHGAADPDLREAEALLDKTDVSVTAETSAPNPYEGEFYVLRARLGARKGDFVATRHFTELGKPFFTGSNADPYEKRALQHLTETLTQHSR